MKARAMWKGVVQLGRAEVAVKVYAGAVERGVHFRLIHRKDGVPVAQELVDPRTGEAVPPDAIRKGIAVGAGRFVALDEKELASTEPAQDRAIEVTRCVPRAAVDLAWYERPYLLGPDGAKADYDALAAALAASERVGIARWTMRRKRHFGMLEARDAHLVLVALRPANEVVDLHEFALPAATGTTRGAERSLAEQLVAALDAPFDPKLLRDDYRERVLELVAAKRAGRRLRVAERRPPAPRGDLAHALRASLRAAKGRRIAA